MYIAKQICNHFNIDHAILKDHLFPRSSENREKLPNEGFAEGFREEVGNELSMKDSTDESRNKEDTLGGEKAVSKGVGQRQVWRMGISNFSCE